MKKALLFMIMATMVGTALVACGKKEETKSETTEIIEDNENGEIIENTEVITGKGKPAEINKAIVEYIPMPQERTAEEIKEVYGINLDNVEEYSVVECGRSPGVGVSMVFKAKDGKVDDVKADVENYLKTAQENRTYPEEKEIYENAEVKVDGDIVYLSIFDNEVSEEAMKKLDDALK